MSADAPSHPGLALMAIAERLCQSEALTADDVSTLADGFCVWRAGDGRLSLDEAFGLVRAGGVSLARALVLAERDDLLRAAWLASPEWSVHPPAAAARLMASAAERYRTTRWPREQHSLTAPPAEPAATWWKVLTLDVGLPEAKRLARILRRDFHSGV